MSPKIFGPSLRHGLALYISCSSNTKEGKIEKNQFLFCQAQNNPKKSNDGIAVYFVRAEEQGVREVEGGRKIS